LSFCVEDGTPLVTIAPPADDEATVVRASPDPPSTEPSGVANTPSGSGSAYTPPGSYVPPGASGQDQRRTWPWILAILAVVFVVFAGLGIAAAVFIPRLMNTSKAGANVNANVNRRVFLPPPPANLNANSNSANANANANSNENSNVDSTTPPPTDEAAVLSDLTDLENEWTAANINADKKKLDRVLADDYVGINEGKPQGKAEYLKTIKRDTSIQRWSFDGLKASLKGDRVSLTGTTTLDVRDEQGQIRQVSLAFTDKFVWRDGRWQATGSEVTPLKE
jgi:ketosteroid isomerase-like protein